MSPLHRSFTPAALQWQDDGELSVQDTFELVRRLREESEDR